MTVVAFAFPFFPLFPHMQGFVVSPGDLLFLQGFREGLSSIWDLLRFKFLAPLAVGLPLGFGFRPLLSFPLLEIFFFSFNGPRFRLFVSFDFFELFPVECRTRYIVPFYA